MKRKRLSRYTEEQLQEMYIKRLEKWRGEPHTAESLERWLDLKKITTKRHYYNALILLRLAMIWKARKETLSAQLKADYGPKFFVAENQVNSDPRFVERIRAMHKETVYLLTYPRSMNSLKKNFPKGPGILRQ